MSITQPPEEILTDVVMADYGPGDLRGVMRGLERAGANVITSDDPANFNDADGAVFLGVGAFSERMENVGPFRGPLAGAAADRTPVFGICLGMQMLLTSPEKADHVGEDEAGGFDSIPGRNVRFDGGQRVLYMDRSELNIQYDHPLVEGAGSECVYFIHSYYADPDDKSAITASIDYGVTFPVVVVNETGTVFGTQFRPEKSGGTGLTIPRNLVEFCTE